MTPSELLKQYIYLHNYGIETADFGPLMMIFGDNAVFEFEDARIGRFEGIETIRGVFRRQAPTLAIMTGETTEMKTSVRADYAAEDRPEERLGYIELEMYDDKIKKLFIGK